MENGKRYKGRLGARKVEERFQAMESDLYNLVPVIAAVNRKRSNFRFGFIFRLFFSGFGCSGCNVLL